MNTEPKNVWDSLEIVKLIVSILTPIIVGYIAYRLAKIGNDMEKKQWSGRMIIEKRLEFYDQVVPDLNDLYCYYNRFGNWKELTPPEMVQKKRKLDKKFHVYSHIFKEDILLEYKIFIQNCFITYTGWGNDAKLRMNIDKRTDLPNWKIEWNELFVSEEQVNEKFFNMSYSHLMDVIKRELEI